MPRGSFLAMFGVEADQFDNKIEFVGAVYLDSYAVNHAGRDELSFCEVDIA